MMEEVNGKRTRKRIDLDPCAKCGYPHMRATDRIYLGLFDGYIFQCPRCKAKGDQGFTVDEAAKNWNKKQVANKEPEKEKKPSRRQSIRDSLMNVWIDRKIEEARSK